MEKATGYNESDVRPGAKDLFRLMRNAPNSKLRTVKKKFNSQRYYFVSNIEFEANWKNSLN